MIRPHILILAALAILGLTACQDGASNSTPEPGADAGTDSETSDTSGETDASALEVYVSPRSFDDIQTLTDLTVDSFVADREIPVLLRFPADAEGDLPVVLWAHPGGWNPTGHTLNGTWSGVLARAGYVVVHFAISPPTRSQLEDICRLAKVDGAEACQDLTLTGQVDEEDPDFQNPFSSVTIVRPNDAKALMDALPELSARLFEAHGIGMDSNRVAVAGWSGGAQVVLALAGASRIASPDLPPYRSPSAVPLAFVALSPQGPGFSNFYADDSGSSWDEVRGPIMVMTGDCDAKVSNGTTGPSRRQVYELMPEGDKWLFYSTDPDPQLGHGSFNLGDMGSSQPNRAHLADALASTLVAFFDFHVRGEAAAGAWIESDGPSLVVDGFADWEQK